MSSVTPQHLHPISEISIDELREMVGRSMGSSSWQDVSQDMIDIFADLTGDHQYIHVDPARAAETPFGGTIAHGFLTVSLMAQMIDEVFPAIVGSVMMMNYGFDRLRMMSPVPAASRIRGHFVLTDVVDRGPDDILIQLHVTIEIEGIDKPAVVADWLGLIRLA